MRLLLVLSRPYPRRTVLMLVCLLLATLAEAVGLSSLLPLLGLATSSSAGFSANPQPAKKSAIEHFINNVLAGVHLEPGIGLLLILIVAGMTLKAGFVLLAQRQIGYTVARVATDLRLALLRALLAARWEYYVRQPVGVLSNAFSTEASRAAQGYLHGTTIVAMMIEALLYIVIALLVSWQAALGAIIIGVAVGYALNYLVRRARSSGMRQTRLLKTLLGRLTDVLYGVKPLKAMARETLLGPLLESETRRLNRALQHEVLSKEMMRALQEPLLVASLAAGLYLALTYWGLPLPRLIVLGVLFTRVLSSLNKIQREYQKMTPCESAFWSLRATIERSEAERETGNGGETARLQTAIAFRNVSFSYGDQPVLRQVSLSIPAGRLTVMIGPSGAGKTSLVDLVIGLIRPQAGEVWIDELPLQAVDLKRWRQVVGYVPQETLLLHDSVLVNVTLGDPALTPAEVETALRLAGAWEFVAAMPEGMLTSVGERGSRLSGGQRQRVAIARALVHAPQLLILDEATASLDPDSEAAICATVRGLRGQMTVLAISHQPALLEVADRVYRLQGGDVEQMEPAGDGRYLLQRSA